MNYKDVEDLIGPPPHGKKKLIEQADFEEMTENATPSGNDIGDNNNKEAEPASST